MLCPTVLDSGSHHHTCAEDHLSGQDAEVFLAQGSRIEPPLSMHGHELFAALEMLENFEVELVIPGRGKSRKSSSQTTSSIASWLVTSLP